MPQLDIAIDLAPLLTEKDVAKVLCVSTRTLQAWRVKGMGPPYLHAGSAVRYHPEILAAWIKANTIWPGSDDRCELSKSATSAQASGDLQTPPSAGKFEDEATPATGRASPASRSAANAYAKADAIEKCRLWLEAAMRKSPDDRKRPKNGWQADACKRWPALSVRAFLRVWDEAIQATGAAAWARPGAMPKNRRTGNHRGD